MLTASLRNLRAHALRLLLSLMSVVLGVAFVAGSFVFTDTLRATFDELIGQGSADVSVSPRTEFADPNAYGTTTQSLPASLLDAVRAVPGVARASGFVFVNGVTIIDSRGNAIGVVGAPNFGAGWPTDPGASQWHLVQGRAPDGPGEVVVDSQSARNGSLQLGQQLTLATSGPTIRAELVGVFSFGTSGNLAGASIAAFDTTTAQTMFLAPNRYSSISVWADSGVSQPELAVRVAAVAPGTDVKTATQSTAEAKKEVGDALGFINSFLLVFAAVALLVGVFIILNTFSMLVAMRTRELALLRALGATRSQVTGSVLAEAAVVGLAGGVLGLGCGVLLALGLQSLFSAIGMDMPTTGLAIRPHTVLLALGVGLLVTLFAALLPARRAATVPPVAAMRTGTTYPRRATVRRAWAGGVTLFLAVLVLVRGSTQDGSRLSTVGIGAVLLLAAFLLLAPVIAPASVTALSWPLHQVLDVRLAGRNASRNPRRTATTSTALMIGVALVGTFGTLAASAKVSTAAVVDDVIRTDLVLMPKGALPFSGDVVDAVRSVPQVGLVSPVMTSLVKVGADTTQVTGVDPATISQVLRLRTTAGSIEALAQGGLAVDDQLAKDHGYRVGQHVTVTFLAGPKTLRISTIYHGATGIGGYVVANSTLTAVGVPGTVTAVYVDARAGTSAAQLRAALDPVVGRFPTVQMQDLAQLKAQLSGQIDQLLALIYALLGFAVIIAVLGIVNTLALSVIERTRELGLVRALGASRRQIRRTVRAEAVLIALFGALLGLALGVGLGVALQRAVADQGIDHLAFPWATLLGVTVAAVLAGVLAAVWPARRAARLDILRAIATE